MVTKRKFEFPYYDGLVDIYLNGMKTHAGHSGRHEHIYLHISENENPKIEVAPHDHRIGMEAEIKDGKVVPLVIERKFITVDVTSKTKPSKVAQDVMREIKRESRRQTFDLGKVAKNDAPVAREPDAKSNVGFSQKATVEVVKTAVTPKSLEDYAK